MNETIQTVMQTEIVTALQHVPLPGQMNVKDYLDSFMVLLKDFKLEIEWNIKQQNSYAFSIDYLNVLIQEFKCMYMLFDGSFDIEFYPDIYCELGNNKPKRIRTVSDVHKYIILVVISTLTTREKIIEKKIKYKLPLIDSIPVSLSKYVINGKNLTNFINITQLAFNSKVLKKRTGEKMKLYEFLGDCCKIVGVDDVDVGRKVTEIRRRANPTGFLESTIESIKKAYN